MSNEIKVAVVFWSVGVVSASAGYLFGSFVGSDDVKRGIAATCRDDMRFYVYNDEYVCLKIPDEKLM